MLEPPQPLDERFPADGRRSQNYIISRLMCNTFKGMM